MPLPQCQIQPFHDLLVLYRVFTYLLTLGSEPNGKEWTIDFPSVLKKVPLNIMKLSSPWSTLYLSQKTYAILHFFFWLDQNHGLVLVTEWGCTCRHCGYVCSLMMLFSHKRCPYSIKYFTLMIPRVHVLQRQNKDASIVFDDYQSSNPGLM